MGHRAKHRDAAAKRAMRGVWFPDGDLIAMDEAVAESVAVPRQPTEYETQILIGLQKKSHVFQGPVPDHRKRGRRLSDEIIARRRTANRIAKRSRKINRPRRKRGELSALAWLLVFSLMFGAALHYSAPAEALNLRVGLRAEAAWIGGNCWGRTAIHPSGDGGSALFAFVDGCSDSTHEYQTARPGGFFGIDPDVGDAYAVSCQVINSVTGEIVSIDYARKGDGHDANCLGRWTK